MGSLASLARALAPLLVPKPATLFFEAACTLPITWTTVHVALLCPALRRGQQALLHAAAGGVGLVAVILNHLISFEAACWLSSISGALTSKFSTALGFSVLRRS